MGAIWARKARAAPSGVWGGLGDAFSTLGMSGSSSGFVASESPAHGYLGAILGSIFMGAVTAPMTADAAAEVEATAFPMDVFGASAVSEESGSDGVKVDGLGSAGSTSGMVVEPTSMSSRGVVGADALIGGAGSLPPWSPPRGVLGALDVPPPLEVEGDLERDRPPDSRRRIFIDGARAMQLARHVDVTAFRGRARRGTAPRVSRDDRIFPDTTLHYALSIDTHATTRTSRRGSEGTRGARWSS